MRTAVTMVLATAWLVSGCAVATHDQREYVRSGDKDPDFVGLQRGGFGNPFDVRTADDRPMADGMTTAIVSTLARKGFQAQPVALTHTLSAPDVRQRIAEAGAERGVLLTLREWKSDTALRVGLTYDITLSVLDRTGAVLAEKALQGRDNLGPILVPSDAERAVAGAFKTKLEQLLDDRKVSAALRGGT